MIFPGKICNLEQQLKDKPEYERIRLQPPIIVTGLFRSGTTYLHRLLSTASEAYAVPFWQLMNPGVDGRSDRAAQRDAAIKLKVFRWSASSDIDAMHLVRPELPEECVVALRLDLHSLMLWRSAPACSDNEWLLKQDLRPTYAMYARLLKYYQSSAGNKRLTLKAPMHLLGLDALMQEILGAMVVHTHRDPAECLASDHKLTQAFHEGVTHGVDKNRVIQCTTQTAVSMAQRSVNFEKTDDKARICHINYTDLITDPIDTVRRIYRHFDLPFDSEFSERLLRYTQENTQHKHGRNEYTLAEYGQTKAQIETLFANYRRRFLAA